MTLSFLVLCALVAASAAEKCPKPTRGFVSNGGGTRHVVNFVNRVGTAVDAARHDLQSTATRLDLLGSG